MFRKNYHPFNPRYEGYYFKVWEGAWEGRLLPYDTLTSAGRKAAEGLPVGCSRTYDSAFQVNGEPACLINMGRGGTHEAPLPTPPREPVFA